MRDWEYESNPLWLAARDTVLTATDVVSLLPELKRVRKNGMLKTSNDLEYSLSCAQLWAEKTMGNKDYSTTAPSAAAARGHCLEPFAVEEFNRLANAHMYHWDDCIIKNDKGLGFSPDALSIKQPALGCFELTTQELANQTKLTHVLEIKSYEPRHHIKCLLERPSEHVERYQLAVAMAVYPRLSHGALMYYNPSCAKPIGCSVYTQDDLQDEIEDVLAVLDMYNTTKKTMEEYNGFFDANFTEQQIYEAIVKEREDVLNVKRTAVEYIIEQ